MRLRTSRLGPPEQDMQRSSLQREKKKKSIVRTLIVHFDLDNMKVSQ